MTALRDYRLPVILAIYRPMPSAQADYRMPLTFAGLNFADTQDSCSLRLIYAQVHDQSSVKTGAYFKVSPNGASLVRSRERARINRSRISYPSSVLSATLLGGLPDVRDGCQRTEPATAAQSVRFAAIDPGRRDPRVRDRLSAAPACPPRLAAGASLLHHLREHVGRRSHLLRPLPESWWLLGRLVAGDRRRADVFRGGDDDSALPRDGPLCASLAVWRVRLAALFHSHAADAHRNLRRGDRHGAATRRPQGRLRHRHQRPVGRAGADASSFSGWDFTGASTQPIHRTTISCLGRAAAGEVHGLVDARADSRGRFHRLPPRCLRRLGGPVDHVDQPDTHRPVGRRSHPLRHVPQEGPRGLRSSCWCWRSRRRSP